MQLPAIDAPAELRRRVADPAAPGGAREAVIARGPLIIVAHGLCAIMPEAVRAQCWIASAVGDFDADQARALLHDWSSPVGGV